MGVQRRGREEDFHEEVHVWLGPGVMCVGGNPVTNLDCLE
jgi:hypothetical protein